MRTTAVFIFLVAFLSLWPLHAQEKRNEFDGEWVGRASPQETGTCNSGTYQIKIKDSEITGTFDIRVKKINQSRTDTSTVSGKVDPDGKAQIVLTAVDTTARSSKFSGTFTSTEFRGSDTRGRCKYEVQLQRR